MYLEPLDSEEDTPWLGRQYIWGRNSEYPWHCIFGGVFDVNPSSSVLFFSRVVFVFFCVFLPTSSYFSRDDCVIPILPLINVICEHGNTKKRNCFSFYVFLHLTGLGNPRL